MKRMRILVAEDNIINQKIIRIILDRSDCDYEIAQDGNEALNQYQSGAFDLILMDCQMPHLDGIQAAQKIREFESTQKMQRCCIIAMTANAMKGDKEKCLSAGMDDFLAKPFKSQQLTEILQIWRKDASE